MSDNSKGTPRIAVIGLGNWGTALAHCLSQQVGSVLAWTKDFAVRDSIRKHSLNIPYKIPHELDRGIHVVNNIEETLGSQIVFLALPARVIGHIAPLLRTLDQDAILVSASKGFDPETCETPLQVLTRLLPEHPRRVVVSGPSFSADVLRGLPAALVAGTLDPFAARAVADLFSGTSLRVYTSDDPLGVELGGILKNVIAIAAGVSDGLGLGDSARAAVITRGLAEMRPFCAAAGAKAETIFGLSGLGDLIMTASSAQSRNRTVGFRLGQGESLESITKSLGSVAEGISTVFRVMELAASYRVSMPICAEMEKIISGTASPSDTLQNLLRRPYRPEFS